MATILTVFPDPEGLLALSPEELAPVVLRLARERCGPDLVHIAGVMEGFQGEVYKPDSGYPRNKIRDVERAVEEAWNWLKLKGIIFPDSGSNGQNGHHKISRDGEKLATNADFETFRKAAAFPKSLLHPRIADKVWGELARGNLDGAAFEAFKAVEIEVREACGLAPEDIGTKLMYKAFGKGGMLEDTKLPAGEREALASLFAGAIGTYKNPQSHRAVGIRDAADANEMVMLASQLLRIVDARRLV